jgi:polar amino acid transport system substrate-binding protein
MRTARARSLAVLTVAAFGLAACGSNSLSPSSSSTSGGAAAGGSSSAPATPTKDDKLAAKLPEKVKTAGKLVVGVDATYAPNEFLADDGKTVQGMDVDVLNAVAARFGLKTEWQPAQFDTILLGVQSGKYDVAMSSFTINADRKKAVNMVSYYNAGSLWAVAKGNPKKMDPKDVCGKNIGVQKGTVQQDEMDAATKTCTAAGKPGVNLVIDDQQSKITAALTSGKVDAMIADSPITLYAIKQTNGQLEQLGDLYDSAPYGIVVPLDQKDFAQAIADALADLNKSGAYKAALTKWGGEKGAIDSFAVNP